MGDLRERGPAGESGAEITALKNLPIKPILFTTDELWTMEERGTKLAQISLCPECGVPEAIATNYVWLNSGVVVQANNTSKRVGFIECENLDPLYAGVAEIIGIPIDRFVIEIMRKGTVEYFSSVLPQGISGMVKNKQLGTDIIADIMLTTAQLNGFGRYEVMALRYEGDEDDHTIVRIHDPFSILLCAGTQLGGIEVIAGRPHEASYREISPGVYDIETRVSERTKGLMGRLNIKEYRHRDGDIEFERCSNCGVPKALERFRWVLDKGIIANSWTGRRMVMMGPEAQDPLFEELEKELGDVIPEAVIEAQKRFIKTGFYSIDEINNEESFRMQLALRGFGNVREMKMSPKGLRMSIDNAACYLMAVGLAQGLFEMAFDLESHVDWQLSEDGDLQVEVSPLVSSPL
jgi:hypothetical protein